MSSLSTVDLFGGDKGWNALDFTASDDRVRGGASLSHLSCPPLSAIAEFYGTLDIKTLGGAGFASQRTVGEDRNWDLTGYEGIVLNVGKADGRRYSFILKDDLLPRSSNGREQSTVSWEYDFTSSKSGEEAEILIKWEDLKPTYRGREEKDAKPLDLKNIKRFSIMMRSFFGTQEGDFSLSLISISAFSTQDPSKSKSERGSPTKPYADDTEVRPASSTVNSDKSLHNSEGTNRGWRTWLFARCCA